MNHTETLAPKPWLAASERSARWNKPVTAPSLLYMVTEHEVNGLRTALARGQLPPDFEAKLAKLAKGDLIERSVEQNCRLFTGLLLAAWEGSFKPVLKAEEDELLRLLAYVRKDDDAIPDYLPDGFVDDQRQVRAVNLKLAPLLQTFKAWRLRHQVPGMWTFLLGNRLASS